MFNKKDTNEKTKYTYDSLHRIDMSSQQNSNDKEMTKRDKAIGIALIVVVLVIGVFYVYNLKSELESEQRMQVKTYQEMKDYVVDAKNKDKSYEDLINSIEEEFLIEKEGILAETDSRFSEVEQQYADYKLEIKMLEAKLKVANNVNEEKKAEEAAKNEFSTLGTSIIEVNNEVKGDLIQEANNLVFESSVSIEFDFIENYINYRGVNEFYIDERGNDTWYYVANYAYPDYPYTSYEHSFLVISRVKENASGISDAQVIYQEEMVNILSHGFIELGNQQIGYTYNNSVLVFDTKSGKFLYTRVYGDYIDCLIDNDESNFYLDNDYILKFKNDKMTYKLHHGFNDEEQYRGGPIYSVASGLQASEGHEYYSYGIGFYEGGNGPFVINQKGEYVYLPEKELTSYNSTWLDKDKLLLGEGYGASNSQLVDLGTGEVTIYEEILYSIVADYEYKKFLCFEGYYEEGNSKIYDLLQPHQYIELQGLGEAYGSAKKLIGNNIYVAEIHENSIKISKYSYEFKDVKSSVVGKRSIVSLEGYERLLGRIFMKTTAKLEDNEFFFLSHDNSKLISLNELVDTGEAIDLMEMEEYYGSQATLIDNKILMDGTTGETMYEDLIEEEIGHSDYNVLSVATRANQYAYIISEEKADGYLLSVIQVNSNGKVDLKVAESFQVSKDKYDSDDWKIAILSNNRIIYDYLDESSGDRDIKLVNQFNRVSTFAKDVSHPYVLDNDNCVRVFSVTNNQYEIYQNAKLLFRTEHELKARFNSSRFFAYYVHEVDGIRTYSFVNKKGEPTKYEIRESSDNAMLVGVKDYGIVVWFEFLVEENGRVTTKVIEVE